MSFTVEQLNEAVSVATRDIQTEISNQLTKANYFYYCLTTKEKRYVSGGTQIQEPIIFAENDSQGFINGTSDVISTNVNQQITFAIFDWKYYNYTTNLTLDDFTKTDMTENAIVSLLQAKKEGTISSFIRQQTQAMHGKSTDFGGKGYNGLGDIFADSGVEYGGLTDTDFADPTTWLTLLETANTTINYENINKMVGTLNGRSKQYGGGSVNNYRPDLILSNNFVWSKFMSTLQAQQRFVDKETLKAGFVGMMFNTLFWEIDEFTPGTGQSGVSDNFLYIMSTPSFRYYYKYGLDKPSPFDQKIQIPNQPIKSDQAYIASNIGCRIRRINGLFRAMTT